MTHQNEISVASAPSKEGQEATLEPDSLPQDYLWQFDKGSALELIIADDRWASYINDDLQKDIAQLIIFVAELLEAPRFTACLRWTNDREMTSLNSQFRDKDKATNVLSFPDGEAEDNDSIRLGDLAFGFETMAEEARQMDITIAAHMRHLIIHGLLHLCGFDHEDIDDAEEMEMLGPKPLKEVEEAQKSLVEVVRRMVDDGEISINRGAGGDMA